MKNADMPASPVQGFTADAAGALSGQYFQHAGLTKRELFAAMAMQGIVSSIHSEYEYQRIRSLAQASGLSTVSEWIARDACKQADALLSALEPKP